MNMFPYNHRDFRKWNRAWIKFSNPDFEEWKTKGQSNSKMPKDI